MVQVTRDKCRCHHHPSTTPIYQSNPTVTAIVFQLNPNLPYLQGPAATAKHLAAASAARALARQQQQARSGTGGHKATVSVFGSFLKFANFDDFFSSLQDDDNNDSNHHRHNQDGDGSGERSGPVSVSNGDGVYLLSGCELPEQDLLEDTDFDLRCVTAFESISLYIHMYSLFLYAYQLISCMVRNVCAGAMTRSASTPWV